MQREKHFIDAKLNVFWNVRLCCYMSPLEFVLTTKIGRLLESILNLQELPEESEVLVVCPGCSDETVAVV